MNFIDRIAEARIEEAVERGELNDLAGEGKPLHLDDDSLVPAELRMAYRILKNAGFVPPEVQARKEIRQVEDLIAQLDPADKEGHSRARKRLALLMTSLERHRGGRRSPLWSEPEYQTRVLDKL